MAVPCAFIQSAVQIKNNESTAIGTFAGAFLRSSDTSVCHIDTVYRYRRRSSSAFVSRVRSSKSHSSDKYPSKFSENHMQREYSLGNQRDTELIHFPFYLRVVVSSHRQTAAGLTVFSSFTGEAISKMYLIFRPVYLFLDCSANL
jgi:hypothetical protein